MTLSVALDFTLWYCTQGALLIRFQLSILLIISNCFSLYSFELSFGDHNQYSNKKEEDNMFYPASDVFLFPWALYRLSHHHVDIARKHAIFMIFIHYLSTSVWGKFYYRSTLTLLVSPHWIDKNKKEMVYSITLNYKMWFYFKSPRLNFYFVIWGILYSV